MFDVLDITIPAKELWDSEKEVFIRTKEVTLHLKHSLVALTRWEQFYKRRFLDEGPSNREEIIYYIQCMTLNKEVDPFVYKYLDNTVLTEVISYIHNKMSATVLPNKKNKGNEKNEKLSSELIYYYMSALNIPFECDKWFLNNLLNLIQIASIKNSPPDKGTRPSWESLVASNRARRAKVKGS